MQLSVKLDSNPTPILPGFIIPRLNNNTMQRIGAGCKTNVELPVPTGPQYAAEM